MSHKKLGSQAYNNDDSSDEEVSSRDVEKIQTLWKDIRDNKKQLENIKTAKVDHGNREQSVVLQKENNQLKDELRGSEEQLNAARESNKLLTKRLKDAEEEIERCHGKIAKQINVNSMQTNQINDMTSKFDNLNYAHKDVVGRTRESNHTLLRDLEDKSNEIEKLKALLQDRTGKLSVVSVSYDQYSSKISQLETESGFKDKQIKGLTEKLDQAEKKINELTFTRVSEGSALLEVEHLRGDVQRLVRMLRATKEYKDFSDYADDSTGSIHFLKSLSQKAPLDFAARRNTLSPSTRRLCDNTNDPGVTEDAKWVPREAFKFLQDFRRNFHGELTDTLIEKILFELNRIWSRREATRISRIKAQCAADIQRLERRVAHHPSYKEVQSKQTISRLKNELKYSYKENRQAFAERTEKNPPGIHYVGESVRLVNQNVRNKKELQKENDYLRGKLSIQKTSNKFHEEQEHHLEKEFDRFKMKLEDILTEFAKKKKEILELYDGKPDVSLLLRKEDWFLENLDTIVRAFTKEIKELEIKAPKEGGRRELNKSLTNIRFK